MAEHSDVVGVVRIAVFKNEAVHGSGRVALRGVEDAVGIVVREARRPDVAAQDGRVGCPVAIEAAGFRAGEAAVEARAVGQREGKVSVAAAGGQVGSGGDPDFIAVLGVGQRVVEVGESGVPTVTVGRVKGGAGADKMDRLGG